VEKHLKIRINSLHPKRPTKFDVFIKINDRYVHYLRAGDVLDAAKIQKLHETGQEVFYIRDDDRAEFKKYLHTQLNDSSLGIKEKALILRESSYALVEELFENPNVNKALDESKGVVENFVQFIDAEPLAMANLIGLSSHDFYTYNHSLDVCIYSLALGGAAGYSKGDDLMELGRGSLFHDIGKRHVATEIICKKGPLDDAEWAQMKNHPLYGLQILNDYPDSTDNLKACVFEHHENFAGNGYPQQLVSDEIHPMAKIVAITDCYDALTTKRSYNTPMSPTDAVTMMKEKLGNRFDPDLINALHSVMLTVKHAN
jgi:HD-GYP domain-containing protein (c-di-GMP phosphodiesterase class II)